MKYTKIFLENRLVFEGPEAKNALPPRGEAPAGTASSGENIAKAYYAKVDKFIEKQMKEEHPKAQVISEARRALKEARDKQPGLPAARALQTQLKDILKRGNVTVPDELKQIVPEARAEAPATPATTPAAAPKQQPPPTLFEQMQQAAAPKQETTKEQYAPISGESLELKVGGAQEVKKEDYPAFDHDIAILQAQLNNEVAKRTQNRGTIMHGDSTGKNMGGRYGVLLIDKSLPSPHQRLFITKTGKTEKPTPQAVPAAKPSSKKKATTEKQPEAKNAPVIDLETTVGKWVEDPAKSEVKPGSKEYKATVAFLIPETAKIQEQPHGSFGGAKIVSEGKAIAGYAVLRDDNVNGGIRYFKGKPA